MTKVTEMESIEDFNATQAAADQAQVEQKRDHATKKQIRGSSLLVSGSFISKAINFFAQILIVRYLDPTAYGAYAYALSIVTMAQTIAIFGLDRAVTRFIPIFHEEEDYDKVFGTLFMVVSVILSLGLIIAILYNVFSHLIGGRFIEDQQAVSLLLILIFLAPVQAIDELMIGLFAVFSSPSAIFFRKHVLGPGIKLGVAALTVFFAKDIFFFATSTLIVTTIVVIGYMFMLINMMRQIGLLEHFSLSKMNAPVKEILAFTIPLLTSELVFIAMSTSDAVMLEYFNGTIDVAASRAVLPTAQMNRLIMTGFATLFTPMAARMFARKDWEGINNLYWQTAIWIAVFTFPIFVVSFSLAEPITGLLYGPKYVALGSGPILAILSLGYYFQSALGFNGLTLKVYGKLRYIVTLNILAAVANVVANLILIPRYGALGAAIGTTGTLIIHNILKQTGLRMGTGISIFDPRYLRVYVIIFTSATGLLGVQYLFDIPVYASLVLAALVSLAVLRLNRHLLQVEEMFPEMLKIPFARWFLT